MIQVLVALASSVNIIIIIYLPHPRSEMYTYVRIVNGNNEAICALH